jgi:hypothetical protein
MYCAIADIAMELEEAKLITQGKLQSKEEGNTKKTNEA